LKFFNYLLKYFKDKSKDFLSYAILPPCYRCVYGKSNETLIILSTTRDVQVILNLDGHTYFRKGKCLGYIYCHKCIEHIKHKLDLPCKFIKGK